MPKLNFCIKRTLVQLDSFAKTGEDIKMEETVIEPCLLDCVGHAACGVDIGAARDANSEFTQMVHLFQSSIWRFLLLNFFPEFMTLFGIQVFYPKAANYLDRLLRQLLDSHAKAKKYDDMLGVHLRVKEEGEKRVSDENLPLTSEMIISSCMQFFIDGVATIETMLAVAVFFLAQNPDIQEKAFEEIQTVLGDRTNVPEGSTNLSELPDITDADLMEMKYIEQIFTESSRLGAFPFVFRTCTKDYKMPESDFVVPKGTPISIPIYGFHMDPKFYPEPEKFDPDRYSAENKSNLVAGTFMPFGQGPRMCLGKNYIRMKGRCFLANLIRCFKIIPSEKTTKTLAWDADIPGKIKGGVWVKLERR